MGGYTVWWLATKQVWELEKQGGFSLGSFHRQSGIWQTMKLILKIKMVKLLEGNKKNDMPPWNIS